MPSPAQQKLAELIYSAAKKRFLKKAVFSKCADKEILRATATLFEKNGETVIQIEHLKKDGKALHKTYPLVTLQLLILFPSFRKSI